jgi:hypothetical protein
MSSASSARVRSYWPIVEKHYNTYGTNEGSYMDHICFQCGSRGQFQAIRPTVNFVAMVSLHTELENHRVVVSFVVNFVERTRFNCADI